MDAFEESVQDASNRFLQDQNKISSAGTERLDCFTEYNNRGQQRVVLGLGVKSPRSESGSVHVKHTARLLGVTEWVPEQDCNSTVTLNNANLGVDKAKPSRCQTPDSSVTTDLETHLDRSGASEQLTGANTLDDHDYSESGDHGQANDLLGRSAVGIDAQTTTTAFDRPVTDEESKVNRRPASLENNVITLRSAEMDSTTASVNHPSVIAAPGFTAPLNLNQGTAFTKHCPVDDRSNLTVPDGSVKTSAGHEGQRRGRVSAALHGLRGRISRGSRSEKQKFR